MQFIVKVSKKLFAAFLLSLFVMVGFGQEKPKTSSPENPLSSWSKIGQDTMKNWIIRSAEKMPEENYNFKPTADVRSYGQVLAHIADSQYVFCSSVLGEKNPNPQIEKNKTAKAEIIAELKTAFAYCEKAYVGLTDSAGSQLTNHNGMQMPKLFILTANIAHNAEHYGNLITYLRMKNIVPPSTEDVLARQPKK
jgi:uncharacterized damage-inducible protein DinB